MRVNACLGLKLTAIGSADPQVLAIDIDPAQLHLARLKLAAVCALERSDAIGFLGYRTAPADQRHDWFDAVLDHPQNRSCQGAGHSPPWDPRR